MPVDTTAEVFSEAEKLGINLDSSDESSELETEIESTDAADEVKDETVETESDEDGLNDPPTTEEDATVTPETEVKEEPKLTLKEFQEIESAKKSLETERNAFMEQKASMEKEFQEKYLEKVKTHDQMDDFLAHLADKDPELFDLIKGEFAEHNKQYSNPVLNELKQKNADLEKKLDSFLNKTSDEVTRTKLDSEMNKVKTSLGKDAEAAGVKIDWAKVEDVWADNPKLSVEQAVFALYGQNMMKASASKASVANAEKKVAARPTVSTAGSVNRSNTTTEKSFAGMKTRDVVGHFARQLAGKA